MFSYSNGLAGKCTGTGSGKYQCVAYMKRFYSNYIENPITITGNAISYFNNLSSIGFGTYANGGSVPPTPDQILCFRGNSYGHVGIIAEVDLENGYIKMIDQNRTNRADNTIVKLDITKTNGRYTVSSFSSSYPVQGWACPSGFFSDGFHPDGTSQAFIKSHKWFSPKIGWPVDNGGGVFVHEWRGRADASFSVLAQDFLGDVSSDHFGTDARSVLILNDFSEPATAYLLASGFYGYYKENDGPYRFGVPITWEEELGFSNSPFNNSSDPVRPGDQITVQKFKRRKNGSYYNNERRTLVWKEGIEVQEFAVGEFSIDRCESPASGQWYIQGSTLQNDIPWPLAGVGVPTGRWFIKPGVYQFVFHDDFGRRVYGSQFLAVITEGNYQPAEPSIIIDQPDTASDPPDTQVVISDPDPPDTQVVVEPDPEPEPNPDPEPESDPLPANLKGSVVISSGYQYDTANSWCFIREDTLTEVTEDTKDIYYLCQAKNVKGRYQLRADIYRNNVLWWSWPSGKDWDGVNGEEEITKDCVNKDLLQDRAFISDLDRPRVKIKVLFFVKLLDEGQDSLKVAETSYDIIALPVSVSRSSRQAFPKRPEPRQYYDLLGRKITRHESHLSKGVFIVKMKKPERRLLNVSK